MLRRSLRNLRDLTRERAQITSERTRVANRIQKVLEDANIKLASVASDVLGVSGRAMLEAIIVGETDPDLLADKAHKRLRVKIPQLREALYGKVSITQPNRRRPASGAGSRVCEAERHAR